MSGGQSHARYRSLSVLRPVVVRDTGREKWPGSVTLYLRRPFQATDSAVTRELVSKV